MDGIPHAPLTKATARAAAGPRIGGAWGEAANTPAKQGHVAPLQRSG